MRRTLLNHWDQVKPYDLDTLSLLLSQASRFLDGRIESEGPAHLLRIRVNKLQEELGEVEEQIIDMENSNPRKRVYGGKDTQTHLQTQARNRLADELLDVALTALLAYYHVTGRKPVENMATHAAEKAYTHFGLTQPGVTDTVDPARRA